MSAPHVDDRVPITSPAAMTRRWRQLLGDGGFHRRELWVAVLDAESCQRPVLPVFDDLPEEVDPLVCAGVARVARVVGPVLEDGGGGSLALALSRPGPSRPSPADTAWADELRTAVGRLGVPLLSVHLAARAHVRTLT